MPAGPRGAPEILLTAAGGQLGREVVRKAAEVGLAVHAARRGELDITDADAVSGILDRLRPALVVNAAAYTAVDRAEAEPEAAFWSTATARRIWRAPAPGWVGR